MTIGLSRATAALRFRILCLLVGPVLFAGCDGFAQRADTSMRLGAQTHLAHGATYEAPARLMAADMGLSFVRDEAYWAGVEPEAGRFDWTDTDKRMARIAASGAKLLLTVNWSNPAYDPGPATGAMPENGIAMPDAPAEREAFARYVIAVLDRYAHPKTGLHPGMIIGIEVWNEANGSWGGGYPADTVAGPLAELTKSVSAAIRARPEFADMPIAGCAAVQIAPRYIERCLDAGIAPAINAIVVHPYGSADSAMRDLRTVRESLDRRGLSDREIWATEFSGGQDPGAVLKYLAVFRAAGVTLGSYYPGEDFNGMVGLLDSEGRRSASGEAYVRWGARLAQARFVGRLETDPSTYVLRFREPSGASLVVAWREVSETRLRVGTRSEVLDAAGVRQAVKGVVTVGTDPVVIQGGGDVRIDTAGVEVIGDSLADLTGETSRAGAWSLWARDEKGVLSALQHQPDDWGELWNSPCCDYLAVRLDGMHPGVGHAVVRRFTAPAAGPIRILGHVSRGAGGDGSVVSIEQDGVERWKMNLPPGGASEISLDLDVTAGQSIDFVVGAGAKGDIDNDAVGMRVLITRPSAQAR